MTAESATRLVENIANVLSDANPEDQTADNLDTVATILQDVVELLSADVNFTVNENVSLICAGLHAACYSIAAGT